jgi:hypothetical protein
MKCISRKSGQEKNDTGIGGSIGLNQDRLKSIVDKDKDKESESSKTSLPPVVRSSWGAVLVDPKADEKDESDNSEDEMAESVSEDDQSLEESESHEGPIPTQPKRNNQEEDDEQVLTNRILQGLLNSLLT